MDLIEQLFGFGPYSGGGAPGLLILLVVAAVIAVAVLWSVPAARAAVRGYFGPILERLIGRG